MVKCCVRLQCWYCYRKLVKTQIHLQGIAHESADKFTVGTGIYSKWYHKRSTCWFYLKLAGSVTRGEIGDSGSTAIDLGDTLKWYSY